jgi:hypothetical protein
MGFVGWKFLPPKAADTRAQAAAPAGASATRESAPPPGVMFDNFNYTNRDDPTLAANGWRIRTEGGGPGISDTWSTAGISFPADRTAKGGRALQLRDTTDGTARGTHQTQLLTADGLFQRGTLAARVFFTDKPASGRDGDHINEAFSAISPSAASAKYSELDFEYQPNGGWGQPGPKMDMVSWRSARSGDRATDDYSGSLAGWHTMMMTVTDKKVTYSVDGRTLFTSSGNSVPREEMRVMFNTWLIDLPFAGDRTLNMRVNWVYAKADEAVSLPLVHQAVDRFYAAGVDHVQTMFAR